MERACRKPEKKFETLRLSENDQLWIRMVHRFRFITTEQAELLARSAHRTSLNERLGQLWAHDYLDRPTDIMRRAFSHAKERHVIHCLGQKGAEWLAQHDGVRFPKGKGWRSANEQLKDEQKLIHEIKLVDVIMFLQDQFVKRDGVRLIHRDQLMAEAPPWPKRLKPHRLPTMVQYKGMQMDRATDPDYSLVIGKMIDGEERYSFSPLELDNNTEDPFKPNAFAATIAQKYECYNDAYERKIVADLYGPQYKGMRVLSITVGGEDRIRDHIRAFERKVGQPKRAGIFLCAMYDELMERGPFADVWIDGMGERRMLV